jgi:hypothetical protein
MNRSPKQAGGSRSQSAKATRSTADQPAEHIREVEETRALLEKQLHSVYWWVFNACRIKGFLRAKHLNELDTEGEHLAREDEDLGQAIASAKDRQHDDT